MHRGRLAVVTKRRPFMLLADHPDQPAARVIGQDHAAQRNLRIAALDEALELTSRTRQRDGRLPAGGSTAPLPIARFLDEPLQLVRLFRATLAGLLGGDLKRN